MTALGPNHYSNIVWTVKYSCFLGAALLLMSLFFIKKPDITGNNGLVSNTDLREIAFGEALQNPQFSGITDRGDTVLVRADSATPDAPRPKKISLLAPMIEINAVDGLTFLARADRGLIDLSQQLGTLSGQVEFTTNRGYQIKTDAIHLNLRKGSALSTGPVSITGPLGRISAGKMIFSRAAHNEKQNLLQLEEGVRFRIIPDQTLKPEIAK